MLRVLPLRALPCASRASIALPLLPAERVGTATHAHRHGRDGREDERNGEGEEEEGTLSHFEEGECSGEREPGYVLAEMERESSGVRPDLNSLQKRLWESEKTSCDIGHR